MTQSTELTESIEHIRENYRIRPDNLKPQQKQKLTNTLRNHSTLKTS